MKIALPALLAVMGALSPQAFAAPPADFEALEGFIRKTKEITAHPSGTAIAVVKDGEVVYEGYFGFADIRRRTPVTRDTAFYIASTTKPFMALNVLLKEAQGGLDTRMSLQAMFPETQFTGFDAGAVSMKDLLVHTSGIDNQPLVWVTAFSGVHDAASRPALVAASYPDAEVAHGTFKYTNVGYNIASVWLDRRFAMPWQDQLDAAVFQPLGMRHSSAYISRAQARGWPLALPYSFASAVPNDTLYLRKADDTMQAAGGLVSTASDLATFLVAQLSQGRLTGRQVLPHGVVARAQEQQVALQGRYLDFERTGYAWGWYTGEYKGRRMLHHFGAFPGYHAHLSFIPEAGVGLVVLNNEDVLAAQLTNLIADYAYGTLLDEPGVESRLSARFAELQVKAKAMQEAMAKRRDLILARPWQLSLSHAAYAGTYVHELLGTVSVQVNDDRQMSLHWGRLEAVATGYEKQDQVRVEFRPNSGDIVSFAVNDGRVETLTLEGMVFKKSR